MADPLKSTGSDLISDDKCVVCIFRVLRDRNLLFNGQGYVDTSCLFQTWSKILSLKYYNVQFNILDS